MSSDSDDDDDFKLLMGGGDRIGTIEDATTFTHSNGKLTNANVLAYKLRNYMDKKKKKSKDIKFFKNRESLRHQGESIFSKIERWYVYHVLKNQYAKSLGEKSHAETLLLRDPVGIMDPPKDDEFCWEKTNVVTSTTTTGAPRPATRAATSTGATAASAAAVTTTLGTEYTQKQFLITLRHSQQEIYLHLRATLPARFAGPDAKTLIQGFIDDVEKDRVDKGHMTEENRFKKGVRVEWDKIKAFVLEKLCIVRMGSHHFLSLFTTMRKDNQTVVNWVKDIEKLYGVIYKVNKHWEAIVEEEVVPALAIWITKTEEEVIMEAILRKSLHNTYVTFESLTLTMPLLQFRQLVQGIQTKKWPNSFKQKRHTKALAKTLVPYSTLMVAVKLAQDRHKLEIEALKRKLAQSNDKINHLERKSKIYKRELESLKGSKPVPTSTIRPTRFDKQYGVCPKGACQLCWDEGLGFRKHETAKCDRVKRKAAVERKIERENAKAIH